MPETPKEPTPEPIQVPATPVPPSVEAIATGTVEPPTRILPALSEPTCMYVGPIALVYWNTPAEKGPGTDHVLLAKDGVHNKMIELAVELQDGVALQNLTISDAAAFKEISNHERRGDAMRMAGKILRDNKLFTPGKSGLDVPKMKRLTLKT